MVDKREFNPKFGVYCCPHVFRKERDVMVVIRDEDWQFLCGEEEDDDKCHLVHVEHLLERDQSLRVLANLENMTGASRIHKNAEWEFFNLED